MMDGPALARWRWRSRQPRTGWKAVVRGLAIGGLAAPAFGQPESIHQAHLALHAGHSVAAGHIGDPGQSPVGLQARESAPCHTVFGYLPYWISPATIQWDKLTHLACFGIEVNAQGNVTNARGWPWTATINAAHSNGVKVVPVIVLFTPNSLLTLLTAPAYKANLFETIRAAIVAGNADGVNIDFEGSGTNGWPSHMPAFLQELRAYLDVHVPGSEITIAGPAVNWGSAWDLPAVAAASDGIFIMGYNFYGSWSSTSGPSSPLLGGSINITNTLTVQYGQVLQSSPEKLILGVPYYGNRWMTSTSAAYAPVVQWVSSATYAVAMGDAGQHGRLWESGSRTPWTRWVDGANWRQTWFDDAESLGLKYQLARQHNIQGVGMWALGYDGARPELWDLLHDTFIAGCPQLCYANCDSSTMPPVLNVDDFMCFINRFAEGSLLVHSEQIGHYANCDGSTVSPVLNVDDFVCFLSAFAAGCP
jgi:spore germination protein YaaH